MSAPGRLGRLGRLGRIGRLGHPALRAATGWRLVWPWLLAVGAALAAAAQDDPMVVGKLLFRQGLHAKGAPLEGTSPTGATLSGPSAACANCHRRSGLGGKEGRSSVPPITGPYLFRSPAERDNGRGLPYVEGIRGNRAAFTEASLARAVREGIDSENQPLSPLMPRFQLGDEEMSALIGYLKALDRRQTPGITPSEMHLATIIAPDVDPVARSGMLAVMNQFVADANAVKFAASTGMQPSGHTMYAKSMLRAHRQWKLHVWELQGPPATWQAQLERKLEKEPVFAVLSGLGGANWAPVHDFCEKAELPCLFPNIDAPPVDKPGFYSVYFSQGVLLEAGLMAEAIQSKAAGGSKTGTPTGGVLQIYRAGDAGEAGAKALQSALARQGLSATAAVLPAGADAAPDQIRAAVQRARAGDHLVLWLRPHDLAALAALPAPAANVLVSGQMGGLERAPLPAAWRAASVLAQPVDLPDRRRVRVDFAMGWFTLRKVAIVAPRVQADTYLACGLLSEAMNHSADVAVREYLIERLEDMVEHRVVTGYYPRLSLAPGQRYASKGGYLVRFAGPEGTRLVVDRDWTVP